MEPGYFVKQQRKALILRLHQFFSGPDACVTELPCVYAARANGVMAPSD